jgi:hypothetical protein
MHKNELNILIILKRSSIIEQRCIPLSYFEQNGRTCKYKSKNAFFSFFYFLLLFHISDRIPSLNRRVNIYEDFVPEYKTALLKYY